MPATVALTKTRIHPRRQPSDDDFYPTGDGKPMAETIPHRNNMMYALSALLLYFQDRNDVYVSGNDFLYYVEGDPKKRVSPDTYVIKGLASNHPRPVYKLWEEGMAPCVVIEFTSKGTYKEDMGKKRELYRSWGVCEYFRFDSAGECLSPKLQGDRLVEGEYVPIAFLQADRLYSEELGLDLVFMGEELRFYNPLTGEWLLTHGEMAAERRVAELQADLERQRAELAEQQAEAERQRAERERREKETERREKEAERREKEAERREKETERQRAELAEQQAQSEWQRAERERQEKETERQRAELAEQQAEAERQQREAMEAQLAALQAQLEQLRQNSS